MGTLTYGARTVGFDDRLLIHLQVVIVQRFRRGDGFVMSWIKPVTAGSGRTSVWMTPTLPVSFDFDGSRSPSIDGAWLARLSDSAASARGLVVTNEDGSLARSNHTPRDTDSPHRPIGA